MAVDDDQILLFPWRGTTTLDALRFALRREGLSVTPLSIALGVPAKDRDQLVDRATNASRCDKYQWRGTGGA